MNNRCMLFLLILSISFGYNPSPKKNPYPAKMTTPVQKINCGTESSPFNAQSPQKFQETINSRTDRDVEIPINYHVIYVAGDSIFMNVTVDNQPYEHCSWDIRDYDNNTFLLYPGFGFDNPGHSYSLGGVLPPGNYALFLYDDFGSGGISATVTTSDGTVLASINQGQWGTNTFLDFTAPEGNYVDGLVSDEIIYEQTNVLNEHYNDLGYSFSVGSIDSAVNAGWYYATDSHKFETGQWENDDQYLAMAQAMTVNVPSSVNFFWTGATLTSGLGVYPWSFDEDDSRHGLFCSNYTYPGSEGTFSGGITGVHEVGHYFGLYHTFENGCSTPGDEVDDTPYQGEPNYGCPSSNYSCSSYDDIGNFMDYMDDVCLNHFTDGQVDRVAWALETYRPTLLENVDYEGPVWHVDTTGSDSTGDGSEENPFATIQYGIDVSSDGDTVLVAAGTYVESLNFNGKNIMVGSLYLTTQDSSYISSTFLDSDISGSIVVFESFEDSTAVLIGFTFQGINLNSEEGPQSIIYINESSPKIIKNRFGNINLFQEIESAVIYCDNSNSLILDNVFTNGMVGNGNVLGGYILSKNSNLIIKGNQFKNGYVGFAEPSGYIVSVNSDNIIGSNIIINPSMGYCYTCAAISILDESDCIIRNNFIMQASGDGYGAVVASESQYVSHNNTFVSNSVGYANLSSDGIVINDIIYGSSNTVYMDENSSIEITFSDIEGGWEGEGNIDADPLFIDTENGDYALQEDSPCIDAGTPFVVWEGDTLVNMNEDEYNGNAPDMGAFESPYTATVAIDNEMIPTEFSLHPPYPNPFNPITTIQFDTGVGETILHPLQLTVYDITGRVVETLVNGGVISGQHDIQWDASQQSSGIYFVELVAGQKRDVQKLILLK